MAIGELFGVSTFGAGLGRAWNFDAGSGVFGHNLPSTDRVNAELRTRKRGLFKSALRYSRGGAVNHDEAFGNHIGREMRLDSYGLGDK